MKKFLFLCCFLMTSFLFVLTVSAENEKTYGQILYDLGIISGSNGEIKEADEITREEMTAILVRLSESLDADKNFKLPEKPTFFDVPANHWAYRYVELAYHKGLTSGIGEHEFGLGQKITYNQAALLLIRGLGYDTADIYYPTAAKQIAVQYGLRLANVVDGTTNLIRGQVFELLAKTLLKNTASGSVKLEQLSLDTIKVNNFKSAFQTAVAFTTQTEDFYELLGNEFTIQKLPVLTEAQLQEIAKDDYSSKAYKNMQSEIDAMKKFYHKYLNSEYKKLVLDRKSLSIKRQSYDVNDWEFVFESSEVQIKNKELSSNRSLLSMTLDTADDGKLIMISDIKSGYGKAGTTGVINEIREYKTVDGLKVYVILGTEKFKKYNDKTNETEDTYQNFYIAATVNNNGNVIECMASSAYGTGYGQPLQNKKPELEQRNKNSNSNF